MKDADTIGLFAELFTNDGFCHLNHGPDTDDQKIQAVDYLVIPIENKIIKHIDELTIPICANCLEGLNDREWLLLICLNCLASQWIAKSEAKLSYYSKRTYQIYKGIILNGCPKCTGKFNGIWYII